MRSRVKWNWKAGAEQRFVPFLRLFGRGHKSQKEQL